MQLEEHRRRRRLAMFAIFGWGVAAGIFAELLKQTTRSNLFAFVPLAMWGLNAAFRVGPVAGAVCPSCGMRFYQLGPLNCFPLTRRCVHCGLRLDDRVGTDST